MAKSEEVNSHPEEGPDNTRIHITGAELQALVENAVAKAIERQYSEPSRTRSRARSAPHSKTKGHSEAHTKPLSKKDASKKDELKKDDERHSSNQNSIPSKKVEHKTEPRDKSCTYKYFVSCKPRDFTGEKGAVDCMTWLDEMDTVVDISGCADRDVVKYVSQSFKGDALAWWKSLLQAAGKAILYSMSWDQDRVRLRVFGDEKSRLPGIPHHFQYPI